MKLKICIFFIAIIAVSFRIITHVDAALIPVTVFTQTLTQVRINPEEPIYSLPTGKTVHLSAMAYDQNGQPIYTGINYDWGISSSDTVGTLFSTTGSITSFKPTNNGTGDLFVKAYYTGKANEAVVFSIKIYIGDSNSTPTPTRIPTPTIASTPTPSFTPTPTVSPSVTPTPTITHTLTPTPTLTMTPTKTQTLSRRMIIPTMKPIPTPPSPQKVFDTINRIFQSFYDRMCKLGLNNFCPSN